MIKLKRAYDPIEENDGVRFLVDRLWPRGLKKERLKAECWLKSVSPSDPLRHWFKHDPAKWGEFQRRYFAELDEKPETWQPLLQAAQAGAITLLFSAKDTEHNNAAALRTYLLKHLPASRQNAPKKNTGEGPGGIAEKAGSARTQNQPDE